MRERGRHFAHCGQTGNVNEFGLQLLQAALLCSAFRKIPNEARKEALTADAGFAYCQFYRKGRPILPFSHDDPSYANYPALTCRAVAKKVAIMLLSVWRWHQHRDILAQNVSGGPTK